MKAAYDRGIPFLFHEEEAARMERVNRRMFIMCACAMVVMALQMVRCMIPDKSDT